MKKTNIITCTGRHVELEHRWLHNSFLNDCCSYYKEKHGLAMSFPMNSFFTFNAVKEFIIDKNQLPVYEDENYENDIHSNMEKLFA